jgi:HK97 family phage prohead protease
MDFERLFSEPLDVKKLTEAGEFEGYASTFGNVDRGGDVVEAGAFAKTLKKGASKVKMLFQHDPSQPLGKWLEMAEDRKGLWVKGKLNLEVQRSRETLALMKDGAIDSLSIGFRAIKSAPGDAAGVFRKLLEVDLWEISLVTFGMNERATVRAVKEDVTIRDVEKVLREAGLPNAFAKLVAAHGFDGAKARLQPQRRDDALMEMINKLNQVMKG